MALCDDVGPAGMNDLIHLFHADMPFLLARLGTSIASRDAETVDRVLAALRGAATHLGLKSVETLVDEVRLTPLDTTIKDRLSTELRRARSAPPFNGSREANYP